MHINPGPGHNQWFDYSKCIGQVFFFNISSWIDNHEGIYWHWSIKVS